jgi:hypothetical protein
MSNSRKSERRQDERRQDERRGRIPGWSESTLEFLEGQQDSRRTSSPDSGPEISDGDDGWIEYFWKPILITAALGVVAKTAGFPVGVVPGVLHKMAADMGRGVGSLVGFTHKAKKKVKEKVQETRRGSARVLEAKENRLRARQRAGPDSGVVLPSFLRKTVNAR